MGIFVKGKIKKGKQMSLAEAAGFAEKKEIRMNC
jgi:hypothetical protein